MWPGGGGVGGGVCVGALQRHSASVASSRHQGVGVGRSLVCVTPGEGSSLRPKDPVAAVEAPDSCSEALLVSTYICCVLAFLSCRPSSHS